MGADIDFKEVNGNKSYWLIRTYRGTYYKQFIDEKFIAIGWDQFTDVPEISKSDQKEFTKIIKEKYPTEKRPGHVFQQMKQFINNMSIGDIVLIPNKNSRLITIGIVESDIYTKEIVTDSKVDIEVEDNVKQNKCLFVKRRNVNWLKTVERDKLDPYLFKLINSHHTITNANAYDHYIDRSLHSLYFKNNKGHLIFMVNKQDHVRGREMGLFINGVIDLLDSYNTFTESSIDTNAIDIKLNVQSPGPIEFIGASVSIATLGKLLFHLFGGKVSIGRSGEEAIAIIEADGYVDPLLFPSNGEDEDTIKILHFKEQAAHNPIIKKSIENLQTSINNLEAALPSEITHNKNLTNKN